MKTATSLPDRVFRDADRAAKRLRMTRSELYRRAIEAFLRSQEDDAIRASYDAAFSERESDADASFRRRASRKAFSAVEWE